MRKILILLLILVAFLGGVWTERHLNQPEHSGSEVPVLDRDYYDKVLSLIKSADHSIHILMFELFYYPQHPRSKTNLLFKEIVNAHQRGVNVKVCVEGGEDFLGEDFLRKQLHGYRYLKENGVEIRVDPKGVTSHAKLLIVDERTVLLGSTNWSYHALEQNSETNISVESPSLASSFEKYFNRIWKSSSPLNLEANLGSRSPIAKILREPDSWDGRRVRISGEVTDLKKRRSRSGNLYSTFYLSDGEGNRIKVFKWGHPDVDDGEQVEVEGVFQKEKQIGKLTFYNELEAETIYRR